MSNKGRREWIIDRLTEFFWALVAAATVEAALGLLPPGGEAVIRDAYGTTQLSAANTHPEWVAFVDGVEDGEFDF